MNKNALRFSCEEDIEKMPVTDCGRFCTVCKKEIIDFRGLSKKRVNELRENGACGIFLPEQVEDGITPIQLPKVRYVAASFLTFLGMEVYAQPETINQKAVPTEIGLDDTTLVSTNKNMDPEVENDDVLTKKEIRQIRNNYNHKHVFIRTRHATYYWSKRFPFIVKRKYRITGF